MNELKYKKFLWFRFKDGWKDLGMIGDGFKRDDDGTSILIRTVHDRCKTTAHVGKVNDSSLVFTFCPLCEVVLKEENEK